MVSPRDQRARIAASVAFAVQGLCFAAVIAQVPTLKDKFALDELQLTATLAAVPVIAGVGSVLAGILAPRIGSAAVLRAGGLGTSALAVAIGLVPSTTLLYVATAVFGLFIGAVDASMNMQGAAVQRRYGRSILASCHAWWSIAAIIGSAAAIAAAEVRLEVFLGGIGIAGAVLALSAGPFLLKRDADALEEATGPAPATRRGIVVLIGIALMVMFIGDAATTSWGGIFLHDALAANDYLVPAGLFTYLTFQFLGRTVSDRVIGRIGAVATVVVSGIVAAGGFALVATAQIVPAALAGFALVGLGLSVVVPLTFTAADALDPAGSGTVIARVNLFNYAGVIVGSTVIGVIYDAGSLRLAFAAPAVLVLAILALAPAFRVVDAARAARSTAAL